MPNPSNAATPNSYNPNETAIGGIDLTRLIVIECLSVSSDKSSALLPNSPFFRASNCNDTTIRATAIAMEKIFKHRAKRDELERRLFWAAGGWCLHHPPTCGSIDAIDNRTIDYKSHGPEFFVVETGEKPLCLEVCDLNRVG